ncbi:hypothetical protein OIU77_017921 [Salix suchowensis]|uniref:Uncharacterized protein n=1 Tax=Salix suchowensis TaxID=1278906 RepID=A0ABQ8ZR16_9ROSI|nr:hypothetical protein OIU77_017921 [Salix suchowensis]
MASIHKLLNIVLPLTAIISILVILPPYLVFKLLSYIKRSMLTENVAGKVGFITGESSGIGEISPSCKREDRLRVVADKARELGSPEVFVIRADVAKVEECTRVECGSHIGIIIVLPGLIESEITVPDSMSEVGHYPSK